MHIGQHNNRYGRTGIRNVSSVTNVVRNINFDPSRFIVQVNNSGIYVGARDKKVDEFEHHFQAVQSGNVSSNVASIAISEGHWFRNGSNSYSAETEINPFDEDIVAADYDGDVYIYVARKNSHTSGDLEVFCSGIELPTTENDFCMEVPIATVTYDNANLSSTISQHQVGDITDFITTGGQDSDALNNFGIIITKASYDADPDVNITGGKVKIRNNTYTLTNVNATVTSGKVVYIDLGSNAASDASLIPVDPAIKIENAMPADSTYDNRYIKLYDLSYSALDIKADGTSTKKYKSINATRFHEGMVQMDWVRPDGQDSGITSVDTDYPKVKGLNFCTGEKHAGELQDYQAYETLVNTGTEYLTGEIAIPYYDVNITNVTEKKYASIDTHSFIAGHTQPGQSLEKSYGNPDYLQIKDWDDASYFVDITDCSYFGVTSMSYPTVLIRDAGRATAYGSLLNFKAADAYHADIADSANTYSHYISDDHEDSPTETPLDGDILKWNTDLGRFVWANVYTLVTHTTLDFTGSGEIGVGKSFGNTDHDDTYWHYAYLDYVDSKSYRTTGEVHANDFFIQDAPTNHWEADGLYVNVANAISLTTTTDIVTQSDDVTIMPQANTVGFVTMGNASSQWSQFNAHFNCSYSVVSEGEINFTGWNFEVYCTNSIAGFYGNNTASLALGGSTIYKFVDIYYNGVAGVDQSSAVIGKITTTKGGVTGLTTVTPIADGTYNNVYSITVQDGHIISIT